MTRTVSSLARSIALCTLLALNGCHRVSASVPKPATSGREHAALAADPEVAAAERAAIAKLAEFRALIEHADSTISHFEVEAVVTEGALSERLWFLDVRLTPDGFAGSVNSQPQILKVVQRGQTRQIATADVVDWAYEERLKPRGGETRRIAERRKREAELADAFSHCGQQRFADGCASLGDRYANGSFDEIRLDTAFQLYSRACEGGSAYGCNAAGWASVHARGTPQNLPAAAAFFSKACATGDEHPFACDSRGFALLSGLAGTSRDIPLGQRLLKKACARGLPQSCLLLELLRAKRLRAGPKLELACDVNFAEQVSRCTGDNDPESCFLAGSAFDTGVCGAPRSKERAADLLRRAAVFGATWPTSA
jgi:uncharacterized protein YegJ (DUF2314 family)